MITLPLAKGGRKGGKVIIPGDMTIMRLINQLTQKNMITLGGKVIILIKVIISMGVITLIREKALRTLKTGGDRPRQEKATTLLSKSDTLQTTHLMVSGSTCLAPVPILRRA